MGGVDEGREKLGHTLVRQADGADHDRIDADERILNLARDLVECRDAFKLAQLMEGEATGCARGRARAIDRA
jgi:hypothetical protein